MSFTSTSVEFLEDIDAGYADQGNQNDGNEQLLHGETFQAKRTVLGRLPLHDLFIVCWHSSLKWGYG